MPKIDEEVIINNLIDVNNTCKEFNVKCWLQDGTLLGLIRDNKLIEWDNDADMACHGSDWNPKILDELKKKGFRIEGRPGIGPRMTRRNNSVDIFLYRTEDNGLWSWSAFKKRTEYRFDMPPFNLIEKEFWGEKFLIPEDPEKWLEIKYGKNWRTPVMEWDYATDPANSRLVGTK